MLRALLDSGASTTVISAKAVQHLKQTPSNTTMSSTVASNFETSKKCTVKFEMPEFNPTAEIKHKAYVALQTGAYNLIIGGDLLHELGIDLNFSSKTMQWNHVIVNMKPSTCKQETYFHVEEQPMIEEETDRISKILDAKYAPANLNSIVGKINHLNDNKKRACMRF